MKIILASKSPRRNEILNNLNVPFEKIIVFAKEIGTEDAQKISPYKVALENSKVKALAVANFIKNNNKYKESIIIGADTIVVYKNHIMGKPKDKDDAFRMLSILSDNIHQVVTSISLVKVPSIKIIEEYEETNVFFRKLTKEDIKFYISTGEPMDKAGGYGIQGYGAFLVEKIEGDYFNVVGLPIVRLYKMIRKMGVDIFKGFNE